MVGPEWVVPWQWRLQQAQAGHKRGACQGTGMGHMCGAQVKGLPGHKRWAHVRGTS